MVASTLSLCASGPALVLSQRKTKGVENSGEGKTYHKTPPQKRFWTPPPPMIRFAPHLFAPCHFHWRKRAQTRQIPLSEASKSGLEGALYSTFPPPQNRTIQNRTIRFAPPKAAFQLSHKCDIPLSLLAERRPNCAQQSLARTVSVLAVAATSMIPSSRSPRKCRYPVFADPLLSRNRKRCRQTGSRQSTPLSTIRTRYGNSVSTPGATRTGKNKQNSLQKGSRYGISVSTPHRRYGHRLRTPFLRTPFPRLLHNAVGVAL